MKRASVTGLILALAIVLATTVLAPSAHAQSGTKTLVGFVFDKAEKPLPNAIVYIKNTKTLTVKTFIADGEASYRFHALSPNVDYEVWAEYQGAKSDTKTLSSFDTRPNSRINLKVNTK